MASLGTGRCLLWGTLLLGLGAGCLTEPLGDSQADASTGAAGSTTESDPPPPSPPATTGGAADTGPVDTGSGDSSTGEPLLGEGEECDYAAVRPECAAGLKCLPQSDDGSSFANRFECVAIQEGAVGLYEDCEWLSGQVYNGPDTCGDNAYCRITSSEGDGECVGLCLFEVEDDYDSLACEDEDAQPGIFCQDCFCTCEPSCNPLEPDACARGEGCYLSGNGLATCGVDASGKGLGNAGDPCEYINACGHGLACIGADAVPDCGSSAGCCAPFCDLDNPSECPGADQGVDCRPVFNDGEHPPGLENLGICMLPR